MRHFGIGTLGLLSFVVSGALLGSPLPARAQIKEGSGWIEGVLVNEKGIPTASFEGAARFPANITLRPHVGGEIKTTNDSPNPALQVQSKVSEAGRAAELGRWGAVQGFNRLRVISMIDEAQARELNQRRLETIEKRYAEICANIRALDENSFRLLGFVPLLSASAIAAVLLRDVRFSPTVVLFSLVGGIVTFGLYRWEFRNIQICKWLQERADEIEQREFGIEIAEQQFAIRLKPEREKPQFKNAEYNDMHKLFGIPFTQRRAETLIYWTTIIAWFALPLILALSQKITAPNFSFK